MGKIFFSHPWLRTLFPLILMGVVAVSGNSLVVEISNGNKILWAEIPHKISFYILVISTFLLGLYQFQLYKFDKNILQGFTAKQYEAAIRNKVAEDVARRSKKLIRDGKIDQLEKETETFKKLYGEVK
jgi:hypothetical protein